MATQRKYKDETGNVFGALKVIKRSKTFHVSRTGKRNGLWECQCLYCGATKLQPRTTLKRYKTCGGEECKKHWRLERNAAKVQKERISSYDKMRKTVKELRIENAKLEAEVRRLTIKQKGIL